ncbi:hypothetical protein DL768_004742 [Monosporascus sp. mg162]|nr:hypothetical protein DL768_004742 [Monosporascus sp. mg162]
MSGAAATRRPAADFTFDPAAESFTASQQSYLSAHPDTRCSYIATGALVFRATDPRAPRRILLLQRAAGDSMPNRWEVPGGGCDDDDESILHAVARELWEEAGLRAARIGAPVGDPHFFTSRSGKKICKFNFVVEAEGRLEARLDPKEHQRFVWASEGEVRAGLAEDVDLNFTTNELKQTILEAFNQFKGK